uniref:Cap-specific mRNA (nucleoside-2'-O-)-methyltransferase 1 n=1 Tax=Panagrellus redivivus TaxID=6233 RepID=A0A7E4VZZ6_PANRE
MTLKSPCPRTLSVDNASMNVAPSSNAVLPEVNRSRDQRNQCPSNHRRLKDCRIWPYFKERIVVLGQFDSWLKG